MVNTELIRKELDETLQQRLDVEFTDADKVRRSSSRASIAAVESPDISNFSRFLLRDHCLENIQFWKEVRRNSKSPGSPEYSQPPLPCLTG